MKLWLAPMEGISDCAFRTLCYKYGADMTFTPMVRVDSILKRNKSSLSLIDLNDTPTGIQLLGAKLDSFKKFVSDFNYECNNVCLNIGCPSPDVIREGAGAALIKRTSRVKEIVDILRKLDLPVYVKMRLGLNEFEMKNKVYLKLIDNVECDGFIVHCKHAREESSVKSHWEVYSELKGHIIPNGDINTREDLKFFKSYKEVMIGRAALRDPSVFQWLKGGKLDPKVKEKYLALASEYKSNFKKDTLKWMH